MSAVHRLDGRGEPKQMHKNQMLMQFSKNKLFSKESLSVPEHEVVHALGRGLHDASQHGPQQPIQPPPVNIENS